MTEVKTGKDLGYDKDNPFYNAPVISTYTEEQAVDDGVLVDLDAADLGHASSVVAPEINQHQMFGSLLGIVEQIQFELSILFGRFAAFPSAGNRTHIDSIAFEANQDFG